MVAADIQTVRGLYETLSRLIETGHGDSPVYLYKGRFGCADVLMEDEIRAFGAPSDAVAIGTFY